MEVFWHTLAYAGIRWYTLAYNGIRWHTLAYADIRWHRLAYAGIRYMKLLRNCTSYFSRTFFEAKKLLQETAKIFDLKKHSVSYI